MIDVAPRLNRIKPSPNSAASTLARKLRAVGGDIVSLTAGEPEFGTLEHIVEAAIAVMRRGETRYPDTSGTADLNDAIVQTFKRENGLTAAVDTD